MSDQTNVFSSSNSQVTPESTTPSVEALVNQLALIKNEQGQQKYASLDEALKGLANAQSYIPQLKSEVTAKDELINQLKSELEKRESVEQALQRMSGTQTSNQSTQGTPPKVNGLDEQAVLNLVKQALQQNAQESASQTNQSKVQEALVSKFGEKAQETILAKAKELGTTPEKLGELASQNPAMVLALFNTSAPNGARPPTSNVNLPGYTSSQPTPLEKPSKSLLTGATTKEQTDYMRKIKEEVYREFGVTN